MGVNWSGLPLGSIQLILCGKRKHAAGWVSSTNDLVNLGVPSDTAQIPDSATDVSRWQLSFLFFLNDHHRVTRRPSCSLNCILEPHAKDCNSPAGSACNSEQHCRVHSGHPHGQGGSMGYRCGNPHFGSFTAKESMYMHFRRQRSHVHLTSTPHTDKRPLYQQ